MAQKRACRASSGSLLLAALIGVCWQLSLRELDSGSLPGATFAVKAKAKATTSEYAKRPQNAYMFFASEKRPALMKEGMSITEVAKTMGEKWRGLAPSKRKPYEKMAADDRKRFEEELASGLLVKERKTKSPAKEKRTGPKRAKSAYNFYVAEVRPKVAKAGMAPTDVMRELGAKWSCITAKDKKPYEKLAAADRERFEEELKALAA